MRYSYFDATGNVSVAAVSVYAFAGIIISRIRLKIHNLIVISVSGYCKYIIVAILGTIDTVVVDTVVVELLHRLHMVVPIDAEHQTGEERGVTLKCLFNVVVELVAVGRRMHQQDGAVETVAVGSRLLFHEVEVGHGSHVVVLRGIGVQADELDASGNETEVLRAEHDIIALIARTEEIVIAYEGDVWCMQPAKHITSPDELLRHTSVRQVAEMHHKVYVCMTVNICHLVFRFRIPAVCVAYEGNTQRVLIQAAWLYLCNVVGVDARLAIKAHIVGMHLKHIVAGRQQA